MGREAGAPAITLLPEQRARERACTDVISRSEMKACSWRQGGAENDWQRVSEHKSPVMVASTWSPQVQSLSLKETVRVVAAAQHGQCLSHPGPSFQEGRAQGGTPSSPHLSVWRKDTCLNSMLSHHLTVPRLPRGKRKNSKTNQIQILK